MDLEHLNRTQTILLTLLTSFVTSIATGIVTVSLMNQAPPQIAATVNHVIEHTVEKVTPSQTTAPATVVKTVVEESDLAPQAIASVQKSIIRIVATSAPDLLVARGLIIDSKGIAITDRQTMGPGSYEAILFDGSKVPLEVRPAATSSSVVLLDMKFGSTTPALTAATFDDPSKLQLGQDVISIGGSGSDRVAKGIISALPDSSDAGAPQELQTSISSQTPGAVLIDLYGHVVGISTTDSQDVGVDFWSVPGIFGAEAGAAAASSTAASVH